MSIEVKAPNFPESVTDGTLVTWHKQPGDAVSAEEVLADVETDKVVFEIPAPQDGVLEKILVPAGAKVLSGQVLAHLAKSTGVKPATPSAAAKSAPVAPAAAMPPEDLITPSAKKLIEEKGLDARRITGSGKDGRILKEDVLGYLEQAPAPSPALPARTAEGPAPATGARMEKRVPMTRLRQRIAERLVEAQQTAAILTTFNEVNMQPILALRDKYKDLFEKQHDTRLGFMSFFVKAAIEALKRFPEVNASIDGTDIVYRGYYDIGIAVGSPRGLVVPVLRDADQLSIAEIEAAIRDFGARAKDGKLSLDEITGGTFSITNGGVFGSLLSTPILNPPQSAILGMHKVQDRPMAENGQVVIRPMMYLALSYDHRIIDGREAVQFLVTIKDQLEDPARMLLGV